MSTVSSSSYYSIGDVLNTLQNEFPDVTISKIRFLETQGLINPERTPSGYRKFYEADITRLRFILQQQKNNFLPLKVIKDRLDDSDNGGAPLELNGRSKEPKEPKASDSDIFRSAPGQVISMAKEELAATTGLTMSRIDELEKYGFLSSRVVGGTRYYDEESLHIAKLATGFFRFGVEARHLRLYKNAAEREVDMFEQIVASRLKQKKSDIRSEALATLVDLADLGERMRSALVRQALRDLVS